MVQIVWEFMVGEEKREDFERVYGSTGTWAALFERDRAYRGTTLLRDTQNPLRYVTLDRWDSLEAYRAFRELHGGDYASLDRACEDFTTDERLIGVFDVL